MRLITVLAAMANESGGGNDDGGGDGNGDG